MPSESDRDQSVERLLKTMLRSSVPAPTSHCIDADRLAAWSEGALSSDESRAVESHLADCARCQAMSAVFARAEPVATAAAVPFWRRWSVLIPLAAGAAAATLLLWTAWPRRESIAPLAPTMAKVESPAPVAPPVAPTPAAANDRKGAPTPATPTAPATVTADQVAALPLVTRNALNFVTFLPGVDTAGTHNQRASTVMGLPQSAISISIDGVNVTAQGAAPPATPSAPPPPSLPTATAATASVAQLSQSAIALSQPPPATPPPLVTRNALNFITFLPGAAAGATPVIVIADFASPDPSAPAAGGGGARGGGGGRGGGAVAGGSARAGSPSTTPMRWRVLASGEVDRSTTRGLTWEPVTIDPPRVTITAGAAPTALVCWLVGRAGIVLLTTDGLHFTRVTIPETTDLASVRATNARLATITTVDGRTFVTTDGGQTWRPGGGGSATQRQDFKIAGGG